ncbi:MAG TPA: c-type cytochrome [Gammaproteobacteria bacterium]|nr:c-type cytochrome [Gammaproteobacteria bacterium]
MKYRCLLVGALALVALQASAFEAVTLLDYSGEEIFNRFCASCHGESAKGDGPVAGSLMKMPADLTQISRRYGTFPADRIRDTIDGRNVVAQHGPRVMPVWGYEFWIEEGGDVVAQRDMHIVINRLVEYLRSLQQEAAGARD